MLRRQKLPVFNCFSASPPPPKGVDPPPNRAAGRLLPPIFIYNLAKHIPSHGTPRARGSVWNICSRKKAAQQQGRCLFRFTLYKGGKAAAKIIFKF